MTVIATSSAHFSNVVKHEYDPSSGYCREVVTVNEAAAKTYVVGTPLGKVTATGKYVVAVETAVDGSKAPVAIVIGNSVGESKSIDIAATTDTKVLVLARGPVIVSKDAVPLGATYNDATKIATAFASLASVGIQAATTV